MTSKVKITLQMTGSAIISYEGNATASKETPINESIMVHVSVGGDGKRCELGENIMEEVVRYIGNVVRNAVDDSGLGGCQKCCRLNYETVYRLKGSTEILTERPACA